MSPNTIPIRHSVAELCAVALVEAADCIESASDADAFLTALAKNHRMWLLLEDLAESECLSLDPRTIKSAMRLSHDFSHGVSDQIVTAMVAVNRTAAAELVPSASFSSVQKRIRMAYRESSSLADFIGWLIEKIGKKSGLPV